MEPIYGMGDTLLDTMFGIEVVVIRKQQAGNAKTPTYQLKPVRDKGDGSDYYWQTEGNLKTKANNKFKIGDLVTGRIGTTLEGFGRTVIGVYDPTDPNSALPAGFVVVGGVARQTTGQIVKEDTLKLLKAGEEEERPADSPESYVPKTDAGEAW